MKEIHFSQNVSIAYLQSEELCKEHETTPELMKILFDSYSSRLKEFISFLQLDDVKLSFSIDNWNGAGVDTAQDIELDWTSYPVGYASIFLGFPNGERINIDQDIVNHTLCHELSHILIFAFLQKEFSFKLIQKETFFSRGIFLPDNLDIPKKYIELLCDTIGLIPNLSKKKKFIDKWSYEWPIEKKMEYGEYYFSRHPDWAIKFIEENSSKINNKLTNVKNWYEILQHYFTSQSAGGWMQKVKELY